MTQSRSRRSFLTSVGQGTLLATLGPAFAVDLGLVPKAFAEELDSTLRFGDLEPLVCELQNTPVERLQAKLAEKLKGGLPLKTLVAAGALANARTFGGEDYIGFHTFMALGPALKMSALMPKGSEALPVFKVLYRNSDRIQEYGGRESETLHAMSASTPVNEATAAALHDAIVAKDANHAEHILAALVAGDPRSALDALIPAIQDNPEVHRTVLPYRAWDMQEIVGTEHALTLLRQSLRYCIKAEPARRADWDEHGKMLVSLLDEFHLDGKNPGSKEAEDAYVQHLSETFATASPIDAARAAASALAEGYQPTVVGEAISLAASLLVLRDVGRLPQWEDKLKPPGCVHGDSVGVHASDAANAWRNLARVKEKMEAEDVLITAFTKILDRVDQYKGEGSFEGWMKRVVVNESLTYLRRNKNMYIEMDIEAADREPDFEKLESHLQAEDLLRMIETLPSGYRIVFNLYAIDGYSHKEIADKLGISENTSKSQLSRARVALQKSLRETEKNLIQKTN